MLTIRFINRLIAIFSLVFLFGHSLYAAKVTLSPSNWGKDEGKACISCHQKSSPGINNQWKNSAHSQANVNCLDCHQAKAEDPDAFKHEGEIIATIVSPLDCGRCHETEFLQQKGSKHTRARESIQNLMPNIGHFFGDDTQNDRFCAGCHGSRVVVKGDGTLDSAGWPNNGIGRLNPDGSSGSCSSCHGRHQFSKAQARQPSACTHCHNGLDSPDKEIYANSKHGQLYNSMRSQMNLESDKWIAGKDYFAAPTCVTCHMGATSGMQSNHDVGIRDSWTLNRPLSYKQNLVILESGDKVELNADEHDPRKGETITLSDGNTAKVKAVASPEKRRKAMTSVCLECHSKSFAISALKRFDSFVELYNDKYGYPAQQIMYELYQDKVLTQTPFDEEIESTYWNLWHEFGTYFRHAAAMGDHNGVWGKGINRLATQFYGKFINQLQQLVGKERSEELLAEYLFENDYHQWLKNKDTITPELGVEKGKSDDLF